MVHNMYRDKKIYDKIVELKKRNEELNAKLNCVPMEMTIGNKTVVIFRNTMTNEEYDELINNNNRLDKLYEALNETEE